MQDRVKVTRGGRRVEGVEQQVCEVGARSWERREGRSAWRSLMSQVSRCTPSDRQFYQGDILNCVKKNCNESFSQCVIASSN